MPRKTPVHPCSTPLLDVASMRPRPDAAENDVVVDPGGVRHAASMRPRPDAAENAVHQAGVPPAAAGLQ